MHSAIKFLLVDVISVHDNAQLLPFLTRKDLVNFSCLSTNFSLKLKKKFIEFSELCLFNHFHTFFSTTHTHTHTHTHTRIYIYIYIYREREREMIQDIKIGDMRHETRITTNVSSQTHSSRYIDK